MTHQAHIYDFIPCAHCGTCLTCIPHSHSSPVAEVKALRAAAQERDRQIAALEQERDDDTALIRRLNATVAAQAEEIERLTEKAVKAALGVNFECQEHTSGCDATMTVLVSSESRVFRAGLHDVLRQVADAIRAALKPESPVR